MTISIISTTLTIPSLLVSPNKYWIILLAASELESEYKAENLYKKLVKKTNKKPYDNLRVLGPYPSFPLKLKNQFRFEILIKGTLPNSFLSDIKISNEVQNNHV